MGALADAFRTERFELVSSRSRVEVVDLATRLGANRSMRSRVAAAFLPAPATAPVRVNGTADPDRLRLTVPSSFRNSWAPILTIRLRDDAGGSARLRCQIGPHLFVRCFSFMWIGIVSLFTARAVWSNPGAVGVGLFPLFALGLFAAGGLLARPGRVRLQEIARELAGPSNPPPHSPSNGA